MQFRVPAFLSAPHRRRMLWAGAVSVAAHMLLVVSGWYGPSRELRVTPLQARIVEVEPAGVLPGSGDVNQAASGASGVGTRGPEPQSGVRAPAPSRGVEADFPVDQYRDTGDVDQRARPINEVALVYPKEAYQRRLYGKVRLRLFVNERGGLDHIAVLEATPPGVFEASAVEAAAALQFTPAIKDGRPVKSRRTIEVNFDPYENMNAP